VNKIKSAAVLIKKLSNLKDFNIPAYQSDEAAGVDLSASIEQPVKILPWEREIIPCGISLSMPRGLEAQIRPRSGLAFKHGITILNTPGTIDSDYRGEIKIVLINLSKKEFLIQPKDRIAQMIFSEVTQVTFKEVDDLDSTNRGIDGFGSTG
jgi:dUTP pyrophosphatase|tara:strand:+ start:39 stop:494 length:456 start_codon:yes stop_codon:yes gene_type:complete